MIELIEQPLLYFIKYGRACNINIIGGAKIEIALRQVKLEEKEVLANLIEKYGYEFSQYNHMDVNKTGLYDRYKNLDSYWTEEGRWAYFIEADGKLAGFVMVINRPEIEDTDADFHIAEFFVMYKYRRLGIGREVFFRVLDMHKGRWQLKLHPRNITSVHFWENTINEYTNGRYQLVKSHPKCGYREGTLGNVFFFKS